MRHRARVCITALIVLLAAGVSASAAALSGKVVFWSMWSSSEPQAAVIQATVADFNAANPGVNVEVKFSGREIKKLIQPALQGGAQVDLWEQDPAVAIPNLKANVLRLDDMLTQPAVGMSGRTVKDSLLPSLLSLVRSYAKPSGLADGYYALPEQPYAVMFFYSKDLFDKAGIKTVPQTWDDVMNESVKLKAGGMDYPFIYEYAATLPNFLQAYISQVYGRGGKMFDAKLNPVFNDPNSEAFKHLQWLQDAFTKQKIVTQGSHETKVVLAMNTGQSAFTVLYNYNLASMNQAPSALAGQFDMTLMPGSAHGALGFAKFYCMTTQASKDKSRRDAAWKFIEAFGGGDYKVAKRWAVEKGLGFAALPLYDDPDVKKAWGTWISMDNFKAQARVAQNGTQTEWMGMWSEFFRPLLAKAMNGDSTVKEVMDQGAQKWNEYKELLGK